MRKMNIRMPNLRHLHVALNIRDNMGFSNASKVVHLIIKSNILVGPLHPKLEIAMDMSIQMQTETGKLLSLTLSFNNDGPHGSLGYQAPTVFEAKAA